MLQKTGCSRHFLQIHPVVIVLSPVRFELCAGNRCHGKNPQKQAKCWDFAHSNAARISFLVPAVSELRGLNFPHKLLNHSFQTYYRLLENLRLRDLISSRLLCLQNQRTYLSWQTRTNLARCAPYRSWSSDLRSAMRAMKSDGIVRKHSSLGKSLPDLGLNHFLLIETT